MSVSVVLEKAGSESVITRYLQIIKISVSDEMARLLSIELKALPVRVFLHIYQYFYINKRVAKMHKVMAESLDFFDFIDPYL